MSSNDLSPEYFELLAKFLRQESGIILKPEKSYSLRSKLQPLAQEWGYEGLNDLVTHIYRERQNPEVVDAILNALTIKETSFFRDDKPFDVLRSRILPDLAEKRGKKELKLWSAACSTGQEAVSLAILLREVLPADRANRSLVFGTDVSAEAIDREAMEGQTDLGQLKHERHERMAEAQDFGRQNSHRVREILRDEDTAQELIDAFRRLRTRDVKVPVTSGEEIHLKNAIQHLAGDYTVEQVYQRTRRIETGDRALAVSCDLSGSMRLMSALTALGACYICTREIGDDFAAVGFHGGNNTPLIKAFDETWDWELVDGVTAGGSTPMPAGIDTALNLFDGVRGKERVLIVITDGMANTSLDGGDPAEESASLVTTAQQEGVKVIGLGVGGVNEEYMRRIFGSDGYVLADSHKLAEALIEIYYRQMDLVKEGVV